MFNIYVDPPPDMLVFTSASGSMWCNINLKRSVHERDTLDDTLTNYLLYNILLNVSHMGKLGILEVTNKYSGKYFCMTIEAKSTAPHWEMNMILRRIKGIGASYYVRSILEILEEDN